MFPFLPQLPSKTSLAIQLESRISFPFSRALAVPSVVPLLAPIRQESGVGLEKYMQFYEQQWAKIIAPEHQTEELVQEYGDRTNEAAAKLLLLWSFLDNKALWYGLFAEASGANAEVATKVSSWIGSLGSDEVAFVQAMRLLRNHSMIEEMEGAASYSTHPVVHKWTYHYGCGEHRERLVELAVLIVGWAVPHNLRRDYMALQKRLLPHAVACVRWTADVVVGCSHGDSEGVFGAIHLLGDLYAGQSKLKEAEAMYMRALQGKEALGPKHTSTLDTVGNLSNLYKAQGKLKEAEVMYMRALQGYEEALGIRAVDALNTIVNFGDLYTKLDYKQSARAMYERAIVGFSAVRGSSSNTCSSIQHCLDALDLVTTNQKSTQSSQAKGARARLRQFFKRS